MSGAQHPGPPVPPGQLSLRLRLLDHQVLGRDKKMLGNVDDVVLEDRAGDLVAVGLLCGGAAWANRQPGALGRWGRAVSRRLDPRADPQPFVLPLDHVLAVGSAVHVDPWAEQLLAGEASLELWLRRHVVGRIPGARGGDHPFGGHLASVRLDDPALDLAPGAHLLASLLGAEVVRGDGADAGRVVEVRARQASPLGSRVGPLVVGSLVHGPRRFAGGLGYRDDDAMGPAAVGVPVRWWHRHDVETPWDRVRRVDWAQRRVVLRDGLP